MKLANGDIFNAKLPLQKLTQIPMPVKPSLQLARLANKLNKEWGIIEAVRSGLVTKYGEANERGQTVVVQDSPQFASFVKDIEELMNQETEVVFDKVLLPSTIEVAPSVLMALEKFVDIGD